MRFFVWAACGTMFTFLMTVLGAALVFFLGKAGSCRAQRLCMGFAGGVMCAASVFSLLIPAASLAASAGHAPWLVLTAGFLTGAGLMMLMDGFLERRMTMRRAGEEGRRNMMLFSAVTLHNIPEGMAVALACASAAEHGAAGFAAAAALALGVGIQNLPEGAAISLPVCGSGISRGRSFMLGMLSGAAEPVFGLLAVLMASSISGMMPLMMAFAAGAMMQVVFFCMLPDAAKEARGSAAAVFGFALMMALDVALG